ncbi:unnamed protein product [Caretta caretta]
MIILCGCLLCQPVTSSGHGLSLSAGLSSPSAGGPSSDGSLGPNEIEQRYVVVSPAVLYHPHTGTVSVHLSDLNETVRDPSGNRIAQWRDVTPQQGIVDLSLPLSAEPALGTYAIQAQGTRHSFSVEEYGVELNATKHCDIVSEIATVTFEDADATYKAGIPYTGKVDVQSRIDSCDVNITTGPGLTNRLAHSKPGKGGGARKLRLAWPVPVRLQTGSGSIAHRK